MPGVEIQEQEQVANGIERVVDGIRRRIARRAVHDLGVIVEYMNSAYNALAGAFPLGVYGSFRVVEYAQANWPGAPYKWQTYAWSCGNFSEAGSTVHGANP